MNNTKKINNNTNKKSVRFVQAVKKRSQPIKTNNYQKMNSNANPRWKRGVQGNGFRTTNPDSQILTREEPIDTLSLTANSTLLNTYRISPTASGVFKWLNQVARNFENYKFLELSFHLKPTASSIRSGEYIMFFKTDGTSMPQSLNEVKYLQPSIQNCLYKPSVLNIPKKDLNRQDMYFIIDPTNPDPRFTDIGYFGICGTGDAGSLGTLYVKYKIMLMNPKINFVSTSEPMSIPNIINNEIAIPETGTSTAYTTLSELSTAIQALNQDTAGMELLGNSELDGYFDVIYGSHSLKFKSLRDLTGKLEVHVPVSTSYTGVTPAPRSIWPEDFFNMNLSNLIKAGSSVQNRIFANAPALVDNVLSRIAVTTISATNTYSAASVISYLDLNIQAGDVIELIFNSAISSIGGQAISPTTIRYCNFINQTVTTSINNFTNIYDLLLKFVPYSLSYYASLKNQKRY